MHRALLPAELLVPLTTPGGRYDASPAGRGAAAEDQDAVRREALEDLYLLSHAVAMVGTASSHFSVAARLWGLSRGAQGTADVAWMDADGVASGRLATGFMHGQLNTTFALQRPEQRDSTSQAPSTPQGRSGTCRKHKHLTNFMASTADSRCLPRLMTRCPSCLRAIARATDRSLSPST